MWHEQTLGVWSDFVDNSVILTEHKLELVVVHLELVLLQKDDLGAFWDVNSNSGEALGFSDEGEDLRVKVDVQFVVLWVTDYESGLKPSLSLLNLMGPFLSPEILEREESVTDLVEHLNESLGLSLLDQVLWELLHWSRDSVEQVSRPGDATRDGWQVPHDVLSNLVLVGDRVVLLFDVIDLFSIVVEEDGVFGVEAILKVLSMENSLELSQELQ